MLRSKNNPQRSTLFYTIMIDDKAVNPLLHTLYTFLGQALTFSHFFCLFKHSQSLNRTKISPMLLNKTKDQNLFSGPHSVLYRRHNTDFDTIH